jgi:riboflavin synthase
VFTGIVEEVGTVMEAEPSGNGLHLVIGAARVLEGVREGDSISVEGVCQTIVAHDADTFEVAAIGTTLSRTTLGRLRAASRVNLERALALGDRLGGHLVQGHVDGVGTVVSIEREGEHVLLEVRLTDEVADVTVLHGSVAINGVSLTVNALPAADVAQVALIPYTWEHTTLGGLRVGDPVNLEGDMIGRFVVNHVMRRGVPGVTTP